MGDNPWTIQQIQDLPEAALRDFEGDTIADECAFEIIWHMAAGRKYCKLTDEDAVDRYVEDSYDLRFSADEIEEIKAAIESGEIFEA